LFMYFYLISWAFCFNTVLLNCGGPGVEGFSRSPFVRRIPVQGGGDGGRASLGTTRVPKGYLN
jgi:hypothetical protein